MNLNQVTIPSIDLDKSVAFYQTLGLKLIVKSMPRYVRFICPEGDATFSVHLVDALPSGHGVTVYFECDNLDSKVKELQTKGITFDIEPTDQSWLWREARLKDPDNNQIILYYAGQNRVNPPWKIS